MATSYTYPVYTGGMTSLREFALTCARAFGSLADMRDEPLGVAIPPKLVADTSYQEGRLAAALKRLTQVRAMSDQECDEQAKLEYASEIKSDADWNARVNEGRDRYTAMLEKVTAWEVKGAQHELRKFMIVQIEDSLSWDCNPSDFKPVMKSGAVWRKDEMTDAEDTIKAARVRIAAIVKQTAERQQWLDDLFASLPPA